MNVPEFEPHYPECSKGSKRQAIVGGSRCEIFTGSTSKAPSSCSTPIALGPDRAEGSSSITYAPSQATKRSISPQQTRPVVLPETVSTSRWTVFLSLGLSFSPLETTVELGEDSGYFTEVDSPAPVCDLPHGIGASIRERDLGRWSATTHQDQRKLSPAQKRRRHSNEHIKMTDESFESYTQYGEEEEEESFDDEQYEEYGRPISRFEAAWESFVKDDNGMLQIKNLPDFIAHFEQTVWTGSGPFLNASGQTTARLYAADPELGEQYIDKQKILDLLTSLAGEARFTEIWNRNEPNRFGEIRVTALPNLISDLQQVSLHPEERFLHEEAEVQLLAFITDPNARNRYISAGEVKELLGKLLQEPITSKLSQDINAENEVRYNPFSGAYEPSEQSYIDAPYNTREPGDEDSEQADESPGEEERGRSRHRPGFSDETGAGEIEATSIPRNEDDGQPSYYSSDGEKSDDEIPGGSKIKVQSETPWKSEEVDTGTGKQVFEVREDSGEGDGGTLSPLGAPETYQIAAVTPTRVRDPVGRPVAPSRDLKDSPYALGTPTRNIRRNDGLETPRPNTGSLRPPSIPSRFGGRTVASEPARSLTPGSVGKFPWSRQSSPGGVRRPLQVAQEALSSRQSSATREVSLAKEIQALLEIKSERDTLLEERAKLEKENSHLKARLSRAAGPIEKANAAELARLQEEHELYVQANRRLRIERSDIIRRDMLLEQENKAVKEVLSAVQDKLQNVHRKFKELEEEKKHIQKRNANLQGQIRDLDTLRAKSDIEQHHFEEINEALKKDNELLNSEAQKSKQLKAEIDERDERLRSLKREYDQIKEENEKFRGSYQGRHVIPKRQRSGNPNTRTLEDELSGLFSDEGKETEDADIEEKSGVDEEEHLRQLDEEYSKIKKVMKDVKEGKQFIVTGAEMEIFTAAKEMYDSVQAGKNLITPNTRTSEEEEVVPAEKEKKMSEMYTAIEEGKMVLVPAKSQEDLDRENELQNIYELIKTGRIVLRPKETAEVEEKERDMRNLYHSVQSGDMIVVPKKTKEEEEKERQLQAIYEAVLNGTCKLVGENDEPILVFPQKTEEEMASEKAMRELWMDVNTGQKIIITPGAMQDKERNDFYEADMRQMWEAVQAGHVVLAAPKTPGQEENERKMREIYEAVNAGKYQVVQGDAKEEIKLPAKTLGEEAQEKAMKELWMSVQAGLKKIVPSNELQEKKDEKAPEMTPKASKEMEEEKEMRELWHAIRKGLKKVINTTDEAQDIHMRELWSAVQSGEKRILSASDALEDAEMRKLFESLKANEVVLTVPKTLEEQDNEQKLQAIYRAILDGKCKIVSDEGEEVSVPQMTPEQEADEKAMRELWLNMKAGRLVVVNLMDEELETAMREMWADVQAGRKVISLAKTPEEEASEKGMRELWLAILAGEKFVISRKAEAEKERNEFYERDMRDMYAAIKNGEVVLTMPKTHEELEKEEKMRKLWEETQGQSTEAILPSQKLPEELEEEQAMRELWLAIQSGQKIAITTKASQDMESVALSEKDMRKMYAAVAAGELIVTTPKTQEELEQEKGMKELWESVKTGQAVLSKPKTQEELEKEKAMVALFEAVRTGEKVLMPPKTPLEEADEKAMRDMYRRVTEGTLILKELDNDAPAALKTLEQEEQENIMRELYQLVQTGEKILLPRKTKEEEEEEEEMRKMWVLVKAGKARIVRADKTQTLQGPSATGTESQVGSEPESAQPEHTEQSSTGTRLPAPSSQTTEGAVEATQSSKLASLLQEKEAENRLLQEKLATCQGRLQQLLQQEQDGNSTGEQLGASIAKEPERPTSSVLQQAQKEAEIRSLQDEIQNLWESLAQQQQSLAIEKEGKPLGLSIDQALEDKESKLQVLQEELDQLRKAKPIEVRVEVPVEAVAETPGQMVPAHELFVKEAEIRALKFKLQQFQEYALASEQSESNSLHKKMLAEKAADVGPPQIEVQQFRMSQAIQTPLPQSAVSSPKSIGMESRLESPSDNRSPEELQKLLEKSENELRMREKELEAMKKDLAKLEELLKQLDAKANVTQAPDPSIETVKERDIDLRSLKEGLQEREARIHTLQDQVHKLEAKLSADVTQAPASIIQPQTEKDTDPTSLEKELQEREVQIHKLQDQVHELEAKLNAKVAQVPDSATQTLKEKNTDVTSLEKKLQEKEAQVHMLQNQVQKLEAKLNETVSSPIVPDKNKEDLESLQKDVEKLGGPMPSQPEVQKQTVHPTEEKEALKAEIYSLQDQLEQLRDTKLSERGEEILALRKELQQLKQTKEQSEQIQEERPQGSEVPEPILKALEKKEADIQSLQKELQQLRESIPAQEPPPFIILQKTLEEKEVLLKQQEATIKSLNEELRQAREAEDIKAQKTTPIASEVETKRDAEILALQSRLQELQQHLDAQKIQLESSESLQKAMEKKEQDISSLESELQRLQKLTAEEPQVPDATLQALEQKESDLRLMQDELRKLRGSKEDQVEKATSDSELQLEKAEIVALKRELQELRDSKATEPIASESTAILGLKKAVEQKEADLKVLKMQLQGSKATEASVPKEPTPSTIDQSVLEEEIRSLQSKFEKLQESKAKEVRVEVPGTPVSDPTLAKTLEQKEIELAALRDEFNRLRQLKEKEMQVKVDEIRLLEIELQKLREAKADVHPPMEKAPELTVELAQKDEQIRNLESLVQQLLKQVESKPVQSESLSSSEALERKEVQIRSLENKLKQLREQLSRRSPKTIAPSLNTQLPASSQDKEETETKTHRLEKEAKLLRETIRRLEEEIYDRKAAHKAQETQLTELQQRLAAAEQALAPDDSDKMQEIFSALKIAQEDAKAAQDAKAKCEARVAEMQALLEDITIPTIDPSVDDNPPIPGIESRLGWLPVEEGNKMRKELETQKEIIRGLEQLLASKGIEIPDREDQMALIETAQDLEEIKSSCDMKSAALEMCEKERQTLRSQLEEMVSHIEAQKQELEGLETVTERLKQEKAERAAAMDMWKGENIKLESHMKRLHQEISARDANIRALRAELNERRMEVFRLRGVESVEQQEDEIARAEELIENEYLAAKATLKILNEEVQKHTSLSDRMEEDIRKRNATIEKLQNEQAAHMALLHNTEQLIRDRNEKAASLANCEENVDRLRSEVNANKATIHSLRETIQALEEKLKISALVDPKDQQDPTTSLEGLAKGVEEKAGGLVDMALRKSEETGERLRADIKRLEERVKASEEEVAKRDALLQKLREKRTQSDIKLPEVAGESIKQSQADTQELKAKGELFAGTVTKLEQEVSRCKVHIKDLEEQLAKQSNQGGPTVVDTGPYPNDRMLEMFATISQRDQTIEKLQLQLEGCTCGFSGGEIKLTGDLSQTHPENIQLIEQFSEELTKRDARIQELMGQLTPQEATGTETQQLKDLKAILERKLQRANDTMREWKQALDSLLAIDGGSSKGSKSGKLIDYRAEIEKRAVTLRMYKEKCHEQELKIRALEQQLLPGQRTPRVSSSPKDVETLKAHLDRRDSKIRRLEDQVERLTRLAAQQGARLPSTSPAAVESLHRLQAECARKDSRIRMLEDLVTQLGAAAAAPMETPSKESEVGEEADFDWEAHANKLEARIQAQDVELIDLNNRLPKFEQEIKETYAKQFEETKETYAKQLEEARETYAKQLEEAKANFTHPEPVREIVYQPVNFDPTKYPVTPYDDASLTGFLLWPLLELLRAMLYYISFLNKLYISRMRAYSQKDSDDGQPLLGSFLSLVFMLPGFKNLASLMSHLETRILRAIDPDRRCRSPNAWFRAALWLSMYLAFGWMCGQTIILNAQLEHQKALWGEANGPLVRGFLSSRRGGCEPGGPATGGLGLGGGGGGGGHCVDIRYEEALIWTLARRWWDEWWEVDRRLPA